MKRRTSQRALAPQSTLTTALQRHGIRAIAIAAAVLMMTGTMPAVASPTPSAGAVESTPAPSPQPSVSPSPAAPIPAELPAQDTTGFAPVAPEDAPNPPAPDVGPFGAYMGQGLKKIRAGLDPQTEISPEELDMRSSGSAAMGPESEGSAATATSTWRPPGIQGMDVSAWQGAVDWSAQWSMGARFAYVKATEGTFYKNPEFGTQYNGSASVGMVRGAYHFALPNLTSGREQAEYFLANGGGWTADGKTLPPLLDFEYNPYDAATMPSGKGDTCYAMTPAQLIAWVEDFSNTIKTRTGRVPMIYTTTNWWNYCLGNTTAFADHPLHIAAFNETGAGPLPSAWQNYTVWQYSDRGPFAGDSNQWPGTLAALQEFAARAGSGTVFNPSIKSPADMIAADSAGVLWNYPASGDGRFGSGTKIGTGWLNLKSLNTVDWDGDGQVDILAQWKAGNITVYLGKPSGGFSGPLTVGSAGWENIDITPGNWIAGKLPTIVSLRPDGRMEYWNRNANGSLSSGVQIGSGFTGMPMVLADYDSDGRMDILARTADSRLAVFRGTGTGPFVGEARPVIGTGWSNNDVVGGFDGFAGAGSAGLVARTTAGDLLYYSLRNRVLGSPVNVGSGWTGFIPTGTPFLSTPPPDTKTPPSPSITALTDAVAADANGILWNYPASQTGSVTARRQIGSGWATVKSIQTVDWNKDGTVDILGQWPSGKLNIYFGRPEGGFSSATTVSATGWEGRRIAVGTWSRNDAYPGVISIDTSGRLFVHRNLAGGQLSAGQQIGHGFNGMPIAVQDYDHDGSMDLVVRSAATSRLTLYRGNGSGGFISEARTAISGTWSSVKSMNPVTGFMRPGSRGFLGVNSSGYLTHYEVTGFGTWSARTVGQGWSTYKVIGSRFD